jgi:hypothetical protein
MFNRIVGVFKLDSNTFEDVEHDTSATTQALIVVLIVAIISGIGSGFGATISDGSFVRSFLGTLISALLGWLIWSAVSWFVGTTFFGGKADIGEMLRVIGFAYSPQVLGIIPCIGGIVGAIWSLIAGFIAVRQGLDLDNVKAFLTILIGFFFYLIVFAVLGIFVGGAGALLSGLFG